MNRVYALLGKPAELARLHGCTQVWIPIRPFLSPSSLTAGWEGKGVDFLLATWSSSGRSGGALGWHFDGGKDWQQLEVVLPWHGSQC
jgi:hypothetical protein